MRGRLTFCPLLYFAEPPPPLVRVSFVVGSYFHRLACHATTRPSASMAALGAGERYVPMMETPNVPVLKPEACAPTMALSTPPARPSYTVP